MTDEDKTREQLLEELRALRIEGQRREEMVQRNQRMLAEAERLTHMGHWSWDIASDTVVWSPEHYRIFGWPPEDTAITSQRALSHVHPEDRATVSSYIEQARQNGGTYEFCFRVLLEDGTVRIVQTHGRAELDESGQPVRMFGTAQDVTEQTHARERLEASHRRFQAVFENALDGILLMDDDCRYIDANPAICQSLGYRREELLRLSVRDITPIPNRAQIADLFHAFLTSGTLSGEYTVLCKDGTTRENEFRAVANVLPGLHLAVHRDITERKQAEQALQASNTLLRAVIDNIPDVVYVKDRQGRNLLANVAFARLAGISTEEIFGQDDSIWFEPETARRIREADARVMARGQAETFEEEATSAAGVTTTALTTKAPYRGMNGEILGILGISRDITERKAAEKALENQTARLRSLTQRLVEVQEEERRHLALELHDEIGQILATMNFQLHAAKSQAGPAALPSLEECARLVQQAAQQVRGLALGLRPAMLDVLGLPDTLHWLGERHQESTGSVVRVQGRLLGKPLPANLAIACFRIAQESLTNILRHARARNVGIEFGEVEGFLELRIQDDGVGFDVIAAQSLAAAQGRLGLLGMAERVQLLRGRLQVKSEPGQGTLIQVAIPLNPRPDNPGTRTE